MSRLEEMDDDHASADEPCNRRATGSGVWPNGRSGERRRESLATAACEGAHKLDGRGSRDGTACYDADITAFKLFAFNSSIRGGCGIPCAEPGAGVSTYLSQRLEVEEPVH
jgi:hypothetical protein